MRGNLKEQVIEQLKSIVSCGWVRDASMEDHTGLNAYAEQVQSNLLFNKGVFDELEESSMVVHNGIEEFGS